MVVNVCSNAIAGGNGGQTYTMRDHGQMHVQSHDATSPVAGALTIRRANGKNCPLDNGRGQAKCKV